MLKLVAALLIFGAIVSQFWTGREIRHPPGVIAPRDPVQHDLRNAQQISKDGYMITPLARFEVEARVLGAERYRMGRESDLSPVDLALGWGAMSSQPILDEINISQRNRFYFWNTREFPIPRRAIEIHSANMHLIPASDEIDRTLRSVRKGHVVRFEGYLVRVEASDGWHWQSSLTRKDTGAGACEVVYVEQLSFL